MNTEYHLRPRTTSLGMIETVFTTGGHIFVSKFLDNWPAHLIFTLNPLNYLISRVVSYYVSMRWNAKKLLSEWFDPVESFLEAIARTDSIVCGPVVCDFFRRVDPSRRDLHIITRIDGFSQISTILRMGSNWYTPLTDHAGEMASNDTLYGSHYRLRVRTIAFLQRYYSWKKVIIHIVSGDPIEFILTCGSSACSPSS